MGYGTEFTGGFNLDKKLKLKHHQYLNKFSCTRRMLRDETIASTMEDKVRVKVNLPIGTNAGYYVGAGGDFGQAKDKSILDYNTPPDNQPSLWCHWEPSPSGNQIVWNGAEKFYKYAEWIQYLVDNFIQPWGYSLNGNVKWLGDDPKDCGKIEIINNQIEVVNLSIFS